MSNLVLGSVQFGTDYGISSTAGQVGVNEIKKILGDDSKNLTVELSYKEWKNNFFPSID